MNLNSYASVVLEDLFGSRKELVDLDSIGKLLSLNNYIILWLDIYSQPETIISCNPSDINFGRTIQGSE